MLRNIILLFCFFPFLFSCEKLDEKETIPSFVRIEKVQVDANQQIEGTSDHSINDAWVYLNDNLIGPFELPATVPLLASGKQDVSVRAGILNNGMNEDRIMYPFLNFYHGQHELVPDSTIQITPSVQYFPQSQITIWKENFDDPNNYEITETDDSDTLLYVTEDSGQVYEGNGAGLVHLSEDRPYFKAQTNEEFDFPKGPEVYLEMHYRSTDTLSVGIFAKGINNTYKRYALFLKNTYDEKNKLVWKKSYVDLTSLVSSETNASSFEIFIESIKSDDPSAGTIHIDNVKVLWQDI